MKRRTAAKEVESPRGAAAKSSRRWQLKILGRRVVVGGVSTLVLVAFTVLLATAGGVVAVDAVVAYSGSAGSGAASGSLDASSPGSTSSSTTSTTSPSAALSHGPDQSHAPVFPVAGGRQVGYGNFNALACASSSFCAAVGADNAGAGIASLSQNAGTSWASTSLPSGTPPLDAVTCADTSHCVAVGQGASARTSDGGVHWSLGALPIANTTLLGVQCPSQSVCLAGGLSDNPAGADRGAIVRSSDGGATWQRATLPLHTDGIADVVCPSATTCIAVGAELLVSTDSGATWSFSSVAGGFGQLRTISCSSATTCVAVGPNPAGMNDPLASAFAIETTDTGKTWAQVALPAGTATLDQVACSDGSQCVASGLSPTSTGHAPLYQSEDGGKTWAASTSPPSSLSAIAGISCPETNRCAAVGRQSNRVAATAATGDMHIWSRTVLPSAAIPPATGGA